MGLGEQLILHVLRVLSARDPWSEEHSNPTRVRETSAGADPRCSHPPSGYSPELEPKSGTSLVLGDGDTAVNRAAGSLTATV